MAMVAVVVVRNHDQAEQECSFGEWPFQIKELDGAPVAKVLESFQEGLDPAEQELSLGGLWAGLATGGSNSDGFPAFVTRSILGLSPKHGLGVATTPGLPVAEGQEVQFEGRDADRAAEEFDAMVEAFAEVVQTTPPVATSSIGGGDTAAAAQPVS